MPPPCRRRRHATLAAAFATPLPRHRPFHIGMMSMPLMFSAYFIIFFRCRFPPLIFSFAIIAISARTYRRRQARHMLIISILPSPAPSSATLSFTIIFIIVFSFAIFRR
jgi:hypothetical protein